MLDVAAALTGGGQIEIGTGSKVELGVATSETTIFNGANATLKLDTPSSYTGIISGFAIGDTLDLANPSATTAVPSANGSNTTLTVNLSGGGTLTYQLAGNYVGDTFTVTHSGSDSLITLTAANQQPVLAGAGNTVSYTLGGTAQAVDTGLTVADTSSATLAGATVPSPRACRRAIR